MGTVKIHIYSNGQSIRNFLVNGDFNRAKEVARMNYANINSMKSYTDSNGFDRLKVSVNLYK